MPSNPMIDTSRMPKQGYVCAVQLFGRRAKPNRPAIHALLPISKSTFYLWVKQGKFPQPIRLTDRTAVWDVKDVRAFLRGKFAGRKLV